jgi:outer membrane protein TolC
LLDTTRFANYAADRVGSQAARIGFESDLQVVLQGVARAYFTHLRNLARLDLNRANIERARVLLNLAQTQLRAGVATQIDVTRAEASLAVQEQALLQQQTATFTSEQNLKRLLDLPVGADLALAPFRATREFPEALRSISPEGILGDRADFRAAELTLNQNRLEQRASRLQRVPTVTLRGNYGWNSEVLFNDMDSGWSAGISLSVPIFDGFRIDSNQRLANSRVRAQELRIYDLQRQISDEVRVALRDAESRNAQIDVARKQASLAAEELRLARIRFEQGVADNRDLVDAQNNLAQANDNLVDALLQYDLSRLELARVRGDVRLILNEADAAPAPAPAAP